MIPIITRRNVLGEAVEKCFKDIYSLCQPKVEWEEFLQQNKKFCKKEEEYYSIPKEERPNYKEYVGLNPYEFYYIPKNVMKEIVDSYIYSYRIDQHQELINTIEILKNYCKEPIVDKYIDEHTDEKGNYHPGYKSYDHPDNLEKEIMAIIDDEDISQLIYNKFFKFLDMAGEFYNWNRELNSFNMSVYLGPSPNTNKEAVIKNWKEYRNQEIEIDESIYNDEEEYD